MIDLLADLVQKCSYGVNVFFDFRLKRAIFTYHSILDDPSKISLSPETFKTHIDVLKNHCQIKRLSDLVGLNDEKNNEVNDIQVSITFDDGFKNNYTNALPVLVQDNLPATFFITTDYVGGEQRINNSTFPMMNWSEIKELRSHRYEIGSHGVTHASIANLSNEKVKLEAERSKQIIQQKIGQEVTDFAYPFGKQRHYSSRTHDILTNAGYKNLFVNHQFRDSTRIDADYPVYGRNPINGIVQSIGNKNLGGFLKGDFDFYFKVREIYGSLF